MGLPPYLSKGTDDVALTSETAPVEAVVAETAVAHAPVWTEGTQSVRQQSAVLATLEKIPTVCRWGKAAVQSLDSGWIASLVA